MTKRDTFRGEDRMLIDGELVQSESGKRFENINPATEAVLGETADASKADMLRAIEAARRAFDHTDWSSNKALRKRCLEQLQEALEGEREQLRAELVAEVGTPVKLTYSFQLDLPLADAFLWPAKMIDEFPWERTLPDNDVTGIPSQRLVWKEPVGVVGCITPWNFPFEIVVQKLGQALATGNTVVLKPAADTPWSATRIGRLIAERTDIPAGVVNVVTTSDNEVAEQLILKPQVDMISFTGSTATGRRILEKGGPTVKHTFLELGGKSAMILLDDADFASVVPRGSAMCMHSGQGCVMQTRMLLPRSRYEEGLALIAKGMQKVRFGDPTDPSVIAGPLINAKQRDRVLGYIERGKAEGARLVLGGGRPAHLERGFYVEPTLFADVENTMSIAQEEIFGPVLVVIAYDDDDDAVRIANESDYGLSGGIFSATDGRALEMARRIRAGTISVNGGMWYGPDAPFGGYKSSGLGRQNGVEGFEQYLETKSIGVRLRT